MFPSQTNNIDIEALSGICGSISIACWVVVFSPQIIENFRRGSAEGLSLLFLIIWLAGDVFNVLGAVMQGVLPTMTILAVYYTLADIVLLVQCFYYRGLKLKDDVPEPGNGAVDVHDSRKTTATERTALLAAAEHNGYHSQQPSDAVDPAASSSLHPSSPQHQPDHRRHSAASFLHPSVDGTHLSPATPFIEPSAKPARPPPRVSILQAVFFNTTVIFLVCTAGVVGWYISSRTKRHSIHEPEPGKGVNTPPKMDLLGQVFGYLCAILYLGSRFPQILLNFRRKSTDGVSLLFFLFACIGNLTYVLSILAYSPVCEKGKAHCRPGEAAGLYGWYLLVNLSWLVGSLGTLLLDMIIFVQFFLYRENYDENDLEESSRG